MQLTKLRLCLLARIRLALIAFALAAASACDPGGYATYFSPVEGQVVRNGAPVASARVERSYRAPDGTYEVATAVADECGRFSFSEARVFRGPSLLGQPVIEQRLKISTSNLDVIGWSFSKMSYARNSELAGADLVFVCDVDDVRRRSVGQEPPLWWYEGACRVVGSRVEYVECSSR